MHSLLQYLWHWLTAVNDHSLQAPFIYEFYSRVLKSTKNTEDSLPIEALRRELVNSNEKIHVTSYGADSRVNNNSVRAIREIARQGITSASKSSLLQRIIKTYKLKSILELGTSFGLNTMYLAQDQLRAVDTFEGCHNTLKIALNNFKQLGYENITCHEGNIDETLPEYLNSIEDPVDFAYIDANHQLEPTLNYFELLYAKMSKGSIMVFDDIHWSAEMSEAWMLISQDPRVTLSIDLFDLGVIFFRQELAKQHYRIRY